MANRIRVSERDIRAGRNDVFISNNRLANQLLQDSNTALNEIQENLGVTVELKDIELDRDGTVVISNAELAHSVKERLNAAPGEELGWNFCLNVSCGDTADLVTEAINPGVIRQ